MVSVKVGGAVLKVSMILELKPIKNVHRKFMESESITDKKETCRQRSAVQWQMPNGSWRNVLPIPV